MTRARDEEAILRETMPALSKAFGSDALVMRNEANALVQFKIGLCHDLRHMPEAVKLINQRWNRLHQSTRYGLGVGSPDLVVVRQGLFVGVEMKAEHGVMGVEQVNWQAASLRARASYIVARSPEEAINGVYAATGGPLPRPTASR